MRLQFVGWALLLALGLGMDAARGQGYPEQKRAAEALVERGNFAGAHAAYAAMVTNSLPREEQRWVAFRLDDTGWRMRDLANLPAAEEAVPVLVELGKPETPPDQRDLVWAESQESLGDFHQSRRDDLDWSMTRYTSALDWWGAQTNLNLARGRYLGIVFKVERPPEFAGPGRPRFGGGMSLPHGVVERALGIAQRREDRVPLLLMLARRLEQRRDPGTVVRTEQTFERAMAESEGLPERDAVLWSYGQWRERSGRWIPLADGKWRVEPDPEAAIVLYRRLISEFGPGKSRFRQPAEQRLQDLMSPAVNVAVGSPFLPGSEVEFNLDTRNVKQVEIRVRAVELVRDLELPPQRNQGGDWKEGLSANGPVVDEFTVPVTGAPHALSSQRVRLPRPLAPGAYLLEATASGKTARELLQITDTALVVSVASGRCSVWVVNALSGRPMPGVSVSLAQQVDQRWSSQVERRTSDAQGLVNFEIRHRQWHRILLVAGSGGHQAWTESWTAGERGEAEEDWRIYALTDRPAYRPDETIEWKWIARKRRSGTYQTPSGERLGFEIRGPQGEVVTNGVVTLNAFGSAWGSVKLDGRATLGEYVVNFHNAADPARGYGGASLFRLEEYRLPEFEVTVTPPEETGPDGVVRPRRLRSGEPIPVAIRAAFYHGSPVVGATAEVVIRRRPFGWHWPEPMEFPWFARPSGDMERGGWRGPVIAQVRIPLNGEGRGEYVLDSAVERGDAEFDIEVAVTDASRREVRTQRTLRATELGYSVKADPVRRLPRPGEPTRIEFRAKDANDNPVQVTGEVTVTRETWWEVWLDSLGREVQGEELRRKRAESAEWPPKVEPGMKEWTLKSKGYRSERLSAQPVSTGTNGVAELKFTPDREGFYRIVWNSPDIWAIPGARQALTNRIRADCTVWSTQGAQELGYRTEGLQLIVDRNSFRVGERAPVMVVTPNPGRWVWLAVDAGGVVHEEVFEMTGTTRLVMLEVTDRMVPNAHLQAVTVFDGQLWMDQAEVTIPPVRNFLNVEVTPESKENLPGTGSRLTVMARDWEGNPVAAEVAVSLVDESIFAIQKPLAPDPRQFFFGGWRPPGLQTTSSFSQGAYRRIKAGTSAAVEPLEMERMLITGSLIPTSEDRLSAAPAAAGGMVADSAVFAAKGGRGARMEAGGVDTPVVVRRDFRTTGVWQPDVRTDASGRATVEFKYPDSTTRWQARAVAATAGNQFGEGTNAAVTRSPLIVRLQAPRFLVAGDVGIVSANVNNNTDAPLQVRTVLSVRGARMVGRWTEGRVIPEETAVVTVPPGGEARVDWQVAAEAPGDAVFTVTGKADSASDGMERAVPVLEYGLDQLLARSGVTTNTVTVSLDLPARRKGPLDFTVQITPSLATTLLDALPYLADYPYGCTEQTLSRFVPAVVVRRTLRDLGMDAETVMSRAFGGISAGPRGNVALGLGTRKDLLKLDEMVAAGLQRLYGFQHPNGAWGWWAEGSDDAWMTAYVLWGLRLAESAGVKLEDERLVRAEQWLAAQLVQLETDADRLAWGLHALALGRREPGKPGPSELERRAWDRLWSGRARWNAYTKALMTLSAERLGLTEAATTLAGELSSSAVRNDTPDSSILYGTRVTGGSRLPTAHWGRTDSTWIWSENGVEATAFASRALLAATPRDPRVEESVGWLLKNRRGASWSNTRSTAISILALTDYLRHRRELQSDLSYEVVVNGTSVGRGVVKAGELPGAPVRVTVPESVAKAGANQVEIRRTGGSGPLYYAVEARFFSEEKPVPPAAADLFVRRDYFRLVPVPTLLNGVVDQRVPLKDGERVASGERVEARLVVETPNDLEYLLVEDLKPAGLEALEVQSGYRLSARKLTPSALRRVQESPESAVLPAGYAGDMESLYVEWRDRRAAVFASRLGAGGWEIRIPYRAEAPGRYAALPVVGEAMYAPEIRGNSAGREFEVREAAP